MTVMRGGMSVTPREATDCKQCQEEAQKNKRGLWAEEDPVAPWDWRRR